MIWPEDEPVPRPYVGAVVLVTQAQGWETQPAVVTEVREFGLEVFLLGICTSCATCYSAYVERSEAVRSVFWPQWEWPPEQLTLFRAVFRRGDTGRETKRSVARL